MYVISIPGATLEESKSISSAVEEAVPFFDFEAVIADFLAGVTVKSLLSGAMILMERATRSLFLKVKAVTIWCWWLGSFE